MKTEKHRPPSWDPALRRVQYVMNKKLRRRQRQRAIKRYRAMREVTRKYGKLVTLNIDGVERDVVVFNVVDVAVALHRSHCTIDEWVRRGVLPKPLYRMPTGLRLWTADQVAMIIKAARQCAIWPAPKPDEKAESLRVRLAEFSKVVHERWKAMPKGVAVEAA